MLNCCMATAPPTGFRCIGSRIQPADSFPLTPALSLWEREDTRLSVAGSEGVEVFEARGRLFPLLWGEGKGEGEQAVLQPHLLDYGLSGRTSGV